MVQRSKSAATTVAAADFGHRKRQTIHSNTNINSSVCSSSPVGGAKTCCTHPCVTGFLFSHCAYTLAFCLSTKYMSAAKIGMNIENVKSYVKIFTHPQSKPLEIKQTPTRRNLTKQKKENII